MKIFKCTNLINGKCDFQAEAATPQEVVDILFHHVAKVHPEAIKDLNDTQAKEYKNKLLRKIKANKTLEDILDD